MIFISSQRSFSYTLSCFSSFVSVHKTRFSVWFMLKWVICSFIAGKECIHQKLASIGSVRYRIKCIYIHHSCWMAIFSSFLLLMLLMMMMVVFLFFLSIVANQIEWFNNNNKTNAFITIVYVFNICGCHKCDYQNIAVYNIICVLSFRSEWSC